MISFIATKRKQELAQERVLLARKPELCVIGKGAVVRKGVAFDSEVLLTLAGGDVVKVEEERFLGDKVRARLSKPVCGWVSRRCLGVNVEIEHEGDVHVCVCVDGKYAPLLEIWLAHYERVAVARPSMMLHVLCLDHAAVDALRRLRLAHGRPRGTWGTGDSTSLQQHASPRSNSREMIARPTMRENEWETTEIRGF